MADAAEQTALALLEEKSQTHPHYEKWSKQWELSRDVVGDDEIDKRLYLPRGVQETEGLYNFRMALSDFVPESPLAINKLLGALYNRKPRRDDIPGRVKPFLEDADLMGHSWNHVVEEVAHDLLSYGTIRVLVNVRATNEEALSASRAEGRPPTIAEEQEAGIRAFIVRYSPLSVIDWVVDDLGTPVMLRIREDKPVKPQGAKEYGKRIRFVEYTINKVEWVDIIEVDGVTRIDGHGSSNHDLGVVPMVIDYYPRRIVPMVGDCLIRYSARADIQKFRAESDIAYDTHVHAHPTFWARIEKSLAAVGVGSQSFIKLDPSNNEDVGYVDAPQSAFEALHRVVEERRKQIYRQANIDPMGVVESGNTIYQGSGVSRAWSFGTSEARQLSDIADVLEQVERRVLGLVNFMLSPVDSRGDTPYDFPGTVQYPEEFDVAAVEGLAEQTIKAAQEVNSPTFQRLMQRRWTSALAGDLRKVDLDKIHKEIDDNALIGSSSTIHDAKADGPTGEVDHNKKLGTDGMGGTGGTGSTGSTGGTEPPQGADTTAQPKKPSGPQPPGQRKTPPRRRPAARPQQRSS